MSHKAPQMPSLPCLLANIGLLVVAIGAAWKLSRTESELMRTMDVLQNVMVESDRLDAQRGDLGRKVKRLQRVIGKLNEERVSDEILTETLWRRLSQPGEGPSDRTASSRRRTPQSRSAEPMSTGIPCALPKVS